ncbi:MAG: DUF4440 domain-containing protein [Pseudomonadota bacterium]
MILGLNSPEEYRVMVVVRHAAGFTAVSATILFSLTTMVAPAHASRVCESVSPEAAEMLTQQWISAMTRADTGTLAELYAEDAVVISPAYPNAQSTPANVGRHLTHLSERFRLVGPVKRTIRTGCNTVVDFGEMQLVARAKGRKHAFAMRYSRVFERRAGYWAITLDHMTREGGPAGSTVVAKSARTEDTAARRDLTRLISRVGERRTPQVAGMVIRPDLNLVDPIIPPKPTLARLPKPDADRAARKARASASLKRTAARARIARAKPKKTAAKLDWAKRLQGFGGGLH